MRTGLRALFLMSLMLMFWIRLPSAQSQPQTLKREPVPGSQSVRSCPRGLRTLADCLRAGNISVALIGDGVSTSRCRLVLTNRETGQSVATEIPTVCISRKTQKPPAPQEVAKMEDVYYRLGGAPAPALVSIVEASKQLAQQGKYENVPIGPDRRKDTIAQLAIWQHIGGKDPLSNDAITPSSVKKDLLEAAKVSPDSLTARQHKALDTRIDQICSAVDLTCKYSETVLAEKPKTPRRPDEPVTTDGGGGGPDGGDKPALVLGFQSNEQQRLMYL